METYFIYVRVLQDLLFVNSVRAVAILSYLPLHPCFWHRDHTGLSQSRGSLNCGWMEDGWMAHTVEDVMIIITWPWSTRPSLVGGNKAGDHPSRQAAHITKQGTTWSIHRFGWTKRSVSGVRILVSNVPEAKKLQFYSEGCGELLVLELSVTVSFYDLQ